MAAPSLSSAQDSSEPPELIDIGSNLGDPVFKGEYHGKQAHEDDWALVLDRARKAKVSRQVLTGDCISGARDVVKLAAETEGLFATVGCHPCRAQEFERHPGGPQGYLDELAEIIASNLHSQGGKGKVVAVGECGLDYDRLFLCPKETQLKNFPPQLELATRFDLPLFLHSRHPEAHADFVQIINEYHAALPEGKPRLRGVVHSHSGSLEEALQMIELGFYIGINGCSLKTQENVDCVKALPLDKLMVESDCPWCEIRASHASHKLLASIPDTLRPLYLPASVKKEKWAPGKFVKGRNEPCSTGQVAWVISQLHGVSLEHVADMTTRNARELFRI